MAGGAATEGRTVAQSFRRDPGGWTVRRSPALAALAARRGEWAGRTVADDARALAAADPDRLHLIDGDLALSRGQIHDRALRLAGWFDALGLAPGSVVSFQLPNWWEAAVVDLAAAMTGLVVNPVVPIYREAEVRFMLGEARSRVVFAPGVFRGFDHAAMMGRILPDLPEEAVLVTARARLGGALCLDDLLSGPRLAAPRKVDSDAVKLLMYTSGTTGRPKGVLHSHNTLSADSLKMCRAMGLGTGDRTFSPSPLTHVSGYLWALTAPWTCGVPVVTTDVWDAGAAFDAICRHGCSFMLGATPFLQDLVAEAARRGETLETLRFFLCGGASVPPGLIREAAQRFPNCVPFRVFGATEVPTMTAGPASRAGLDLAAETDGRLLGCEVRLVHPETGEPVADGEEGEILAREPSMALGYARPEDNEEAYDADGFFRTGDLGRLVHGDHIVCTGRKKDLIIRAGENISAREIEDVLFRSPRIAEAAVVAMPSARTGEAVCAFVVPAGEEAVDLAHVAALVGAAGLARQKTPERVIPVAELPKTASGKVRKDILRGMAAASREEETA
ncbi:MAG: AMP-binding protein [Alphaproteobacteria bacterium]|nr:AMP-binding protein [Alphaproteobacteria bacterium]